MMDLGHFKVFLDTCSPLLNEISFSGSGEPFLHPQINEFLRYAASVKRKFVSCCSNGMRLRDFEGVIKTGVQRLFIDVDGLTPAQQATYRKGSDLEQVLENLSGLIKTKRRIHASSPSIYVYSLISRHNESDTAGLISLARKVGVDGIVLVPIIDDVYKTTSWFPETGPFRPSA
jgi:MoaA/NifB/PqqE/SkfB family radical SAM enzyme